MQIKTKDFQEACKKILGALDTDVAIKTAAYGYDTLELKGKGDHIDLIVSNGTYYVGVSLEAADAGEGWHLTVDGKLFLSLIAKITTDSIELSQKGNSLSVKANGKYKFPLKYDSAGEVIDIPEIWLGDVTAEFPIDGSILLSISEENSKELLKKKATRPIQQMYYVDGDGCVTWTNSSACINHFSLAKPIRILLPQKVAKLFKLFVPGEVSVKLGHAQSGDVAQTRIGFTQGDVSVSAILPAGEALFSSIPLDALRGRADKNYPSKVTLDAGELSSALDRLSLFGANGFSSPVIEFSFNGGDATVKEVERGNVESVHVEGGEGFGGKSFTALIDSIKPIIQGCGGKDVTFSFDDGPAFVVSVGGIKNVVAKAVVRP